MNALRKEAFFDRLPDEVEIKNAEQLRTIVASQIKEGEPTKLSLALEGGEVRTVTLAPALTASLLEVLRLVSSGRGFRMIPVELEAHHTAGRGPSQCVPPVSGKASRGRRDSLCEDRPSSPGSCRRPLCLQGEA